MSDEVSLKKVVAKVLYIARYLQAKWIFLLIAGLIGGSVGLVYAFSKKPVYTTSLTFVLEEEKPGGLGGLGSLAGQFGIDIGSGGGASVFSGENLLALMKSKYIVQKVLMQSIKMDGRYQTLADIYIDLNKDEKWAKSALKQKIYYKPNSDPNKFTRVQNSYMGAIYGEVLNNNLKIDREDKKTSIISKKVTSEDEIFSLNFTEILASEVSKFYVETKTKKSSQNLAILQHQTDSVRRVFNSAITGTAISIDANPNLNPARQILLVPSQRRQSEVQIN